MDGNLVFPVPPDDIIKKTAYPTLELLWGSGLSWRNGRWRTMGGGRGRGGRRPWFPCCEKNEWFQSVHIFLSAMLGFQCEKILMLTLPKTLVLFLHTRRVPEAT